VERDIYNLRLPQSITAKYFGPLDTVYGLGQGGSERGWLTKREEVDIEAPNTVTASLDIRV
jgi:hypothetical protein